MNNEQTTVVVVGAYGKLGSAIWQELQAHGTRYQCIGLVRQARSTSIKSVFTSFSAIERECALPNRPVVVYAVKAPDLPGRLEEAVEKGFRYHAIATTGLIEGAKSKIRELAQRVSIVYAPNFSGRVMILADHCATLATQLLDADVEILEVHHAAKADAPSGTALFLARVIEEARWTKDKNRLSWVFIGRNPEHGARRKGEICIHSLRGGTVIGEHMVHFLLDGERFLIGHIAENQTLFARGALTPIDWLAKVNEGPGLFGMPHLLNLPKLIELWPKLF